LNADQILRTLFALPFSAAQQVVGGLSGKYNPKWSHHILKMDKLKHNRG
jgi:hypothetical protein